MHDSKIQRINIIKTSRSTNSTSYIEVEKLVRDFITIKNWIKKHNQATLQYSSAQFQEKRARGHNEITNMELASSIGAKNKIEEMKKKKGMNGKKEGKDKSKLRD